jgi:hypothetical protein
MDVTTCSIAIINRPSRAAWVAVESARVPQLVFGNRSPLPPFAVAWCRRMKCFSYLDRGATRSKGDCGQSHGSPATKESSDACRDCVERKRAPELPCRPGNAASLARAWPVWKVLPGLVVDQGSRREVRPIARNRQKRRPVEPSRGRCRVLVDGLWRNAALERSREPGVREAVVERGLRENETPSVVEGCP